jgi:hypothetical protein
MPAEIHPDAIHGPCVASWPDEVTATARDTAVTGRPGDD